MTRPGTGTGRRAASWPAAIVVAVVGFVLLGLLAGWVWSQLAHPPEYTVYRRNYAYYSSEAEFGHAFDMDLTFAWIAAIAGVVGGLVLGWRCWSLGWAITVLAVVAAAAATVVAWRAGVFLGPSAVHESAAAAHPGDTFAAPVRLGTRSILLIWPLATLLGVMVSVWLRAPRDELPAGTWTIDSA